MSGWDYFWGGLQVAGGVGEVVLGAAVAGVGAAATPITGGASLGLAMGGAAIGAHGLDQIYAGLTGHPSYASRIGGAAAEKLGLPVWVGEIAGDIGPGFSGLASQIKNLPKLVRNISSATGKALAYGIDALRKGGALKHVLAKLSPDKLKELLQKGLISEQDLRDAGIDPKKILGAGVKISRIPIKLKPLKLAGITNDELDLARAAGNLPEQVVARKKVAEAFYREKLGMNISSAKNHMDGIDFSKPVVVGIVDEPIHGIQYHALDRTGSYTTLPGYSMEDVGVGRLGLDESGKIVEKTPRDVTIPTGTPVMMSTATGMDDVFSLHPVDHTGPIPDFTGDGPNVATTSQSTTGGGLQFAHPPLKKNR